jgi:hypothetical protein
MASSAYAAPNVTNVTQKGSLLIWPDIRVDGNWNTLVRIQNDGSSDVDVICYWMDGNKNRVDLIFTITRNQPVWFDARTGNGTYQINPFPNTPSNGFDNPFLVGPPFTAGTTESTDTNGPYLEGLLACWAIDGGAQNQVKWNHLSGTATVYNPSEGAYEYNAYAFFVPTGADLEVVGTSPGTLNLNGVEYDSCPLYQIGQFTPAGAGIETPVDNPATLGVVSNRLAIAGCTLNLNQDWVPVYTKLTFDVWNENEVKFTGAFECADSWHETDFSPTLSTTNGGPIDAGAQNFQFSGLGTYSARYRVQGIKSTQCENTSAKPPIVTQAVGVLAVQSTDLTLGDYVGTTLAAAGKFTGRIVWDPEGIVPEGGIR